MLKNRNIICVSSIDWDFIWQGHQEIMSRLAKNGNRVLFIENMGVRAPTLRDLPRLKSRIKNWLKGVKGIRKVRENLYVFSPVIFPFPYSRFFRFLNRIILFPVIKAWMKVFGFEAPVMWVFLPTGIVLDLVNELDSEALVYYCVDRFAYSSKIASKIKRSERKLLEKADLVFASTQNLAEDCLKYRKDVNVFYFGLDTKNFESIRDRDDQPPEEMKTISRPIIGYIGGVHKWIDFDLVRQIAQRYSDASVVLVGPVQTDTSRLSDLKNVYFLGQKDYLEIPRYIKLFDVGIIPYVISDYTIVGRPTKLNEYLIMGKPVVSTDMPELSVLAKDLAGSIRVAKDAAGFMQAIGDFLSKDDGSAKIERIKFAEKYDWGKILEEMSSAIEDKIEKKREEKALKWGDVFVSFLESTRKRLLRLAVIAAAAYFLLFYTPLVPFLAQPLKKQDEPRKAQAIVVFAGGVGESGRAGQGYEERVEYAVELYKKGFADHLVFSSGYMYVFKEPLMMKLLAVSMGVPADAISIEDKAASTYENVVFSSRLLREKGWKSALIISSPYHMRRVSMVFAKNAPDINASFLSPSRSHFYSQPKKYLFGGFLRKQVDFAQIKAIAHEYIGIVYYWLKRYI